MRRLLRRVEAVSPTDQAAARAALARLLRRQLRVLQSELPIPNLDDVQRDTLIAQLEDEIEELSGGALARTAAGAWAKAEHGARRLIARFGRAVMPRRFGR